MTDVERKTNDLTNMHGRSHGALRRLPVLAANPDAPQGRGYNLRASSLIRHSAFVLRH